MKTEWKVPRIDRRRPRFRPRPVLIRRFDHRTRPRRAKGLAIDDPDSSRRLAGPITLCATGLFALLVASLLLPTAFAPWLWGAAIALGLVICWQLYRVVRALAAELRIARS